MVALLPDSLFMLFADSSLPERAKWIANRVGLGAVMHRRPPTLPFADLRRLELAKAIARDPKVVLVDEPFRSEVDRQPRRSRRRDAPAAADIAVRGPPPA